MSNPFICLLFHLPPRLMIQELEKEEERKKKKEEEEGGHQSEDNVRPHHAFKVHAHVCKKKLLPCMHLCIKYS